MKKRIAYRSNLEGYNHSRLPEFTEKEKNYIRGTLDYLSIQTYSANAVSNIEEPNLNTTSFNNDLATNATATNSPLVSLFYYLFTFGTVAD